MTLTEFDFQLPPELIAQEPIEQRDAARLMTLNRTTGGIDETIFASLPGLLSPGDLVVVNDTKVIPARIFGRKESGGTIEIFLVRRHPAPEECWDCLVRSSKPPRPGTTIYLPGGCSAFVIERSSAELWQLSFTPAEGFADWLELNGAMPLPPYIRRPAEEGDRERYQTVFASTRGAVAAPTAGLHITCSLLETMRNRGIEIANLTLHVGLGTFQPIRVTDIREHRIHHEQYMIPALTAEKVNAVKKRGGRIIALGTTTTRALEHAVGRDGLVRAGEGVADIFIYPGYQFRVIDGLITNFHLPCSTLLLLVSAFASREFVLRAYDEAVQRHFRFYSYGDAMFIS